MAEMQAPPRGNWIASVVAWFSNHIKHHPPGIDTMQGPSRNDEQQKGKRVITSIHRTAGAPQRMEGRSTERSRTEVAPPSLAELQARQDKISPTRRPTKYRDAREEVAPGSLSVPDVPPTKCK